MKVVTIDLLEGEQRVLELEPAEGRDPMEPGWVYPRRFMLRVVKMFEGAALLEYVPVSNGPATNS